MSTRAARQAPTRAERQARTRGELIDAAARLFAEQGFRATSLDAVADTAGFTKGAVYSNFASKEDLFFAVYERRVERHVAHVEALLEDGTRTPGDVVAFLTAEVARRRTRDDGWFAVFLEFWTHVLRHPEHRARFAALHARAVEPLERAFGQQAAERGSTPRLDARVAARAGFAMATGLGLEQLTAPGVVDAEDVVAAQALWFDAVMPAAAPASEAGGEDGHAVPDPADRRRRARPARRQEADRR